MVYDDAMKTLHPPESPSRLVSAVVAIPWRRGRGYRRAALLLLLSAMSTATYRVCGANGHFRLRVLAVSCLDAVSSSI